MKRLAMAVAVWLGLAGAAVAGTSVTMDGPMTDSNAALGQAYSKNFTLNMDDHNIDYVSVQTIYSSGTYSNQTFNDGRASTFTITVVTATSLSTAAATGQFTMVSTSVASGVAGSGVVVFGTNNGNANIKITGPPGGLNYTIGGNVGLGFVSSNTASNFATAVNLSSNTSLVTATQSGTNAYVTLTCVNAGVFCNSYAVTSSSGTQVSTAAFSGGAAPVQVTIGPNVYRAVFDFAVGANTSAMATNLATAVAAASATTHVDAVAGAAVVYTSQTVTGSAGNVQFLSSNASAISTSAPTMTGGQDNACFSINGITSCANRDWFPTSAVGTTADRIYASINSSYTIVVATDNAVAGIVYATATVVGVNYAITSSSQTPLRISPFTSSSTVTGAASGTMYGGLASSYTISASTIKLPAHGYPTGLPVWLSTGTSITVSPLTLNSTYYVIPIDANNIQLSATSTGAVAGLPIVFTSSRTNTTTDSFTLNVSSTPGSGTFGFWSSNDGNLYTQYGSTYTAAFIYPSTAAFTDIGNYDYKWLQARIVVPTAGAMPISVYIHGEKR